MFTLYYTPQLIARRWLAAGTYPTREEATKAAHALAVGRPEVKEIRVVPAGCPGWEPAKQEK